MTDEKLKFLTIDQAMILGAQWRAVARIRNDTNVPPVITGAADDWRAEMEWLDVPIQLRCLVCDGPFPVTFSVPQIAEWTDRPRGLCGTCADKEDR